MPGWVPLLPIQRSRLFSGSSMRLAPFRYKSHWPPIPTQPFSGLPTKPSGELADQWRDSARRRSAMERVYINGNGNGDGHIRDADLDQGGIAIPARPPRPPVLNRLLPGVHANEMAQLLHAEFVP